MNNKGQNFNRPNFKQLRLGNQPEGHFSGILATPKQPAQSQSDLQSYQHRDKRRNDVRVSVSGFYLHNTWQRECHGSH